jgi:hypothetical protein
MDPHAQSELDARLLVDQLLRINAGTYEAGRYQVAYHILAAALHCAEELSDLELAMTVQRRAERQQAELDGAAPAHQLSTAAATGRGTSALFTSLGRTAHAAATRIKGQIVQEQAGAARRRHPPSAE